MTDDLNPKPIQFDDTPEEETPIAPPPLPAAEGATVVAPPPVPVPASNSYSPPQNPFDDPVTFDSPAPAPEPITFASAAPSPEPVTFDSPEPQPVSPEVNFGGGPSAPVAEPPKKKNNTVLIIVIVAAVLLLCCCIILGIIFVPTLIEEFAMMTSNSYLPLLQ